MSADQSFQTLKQFFETREASRQALGLLQEGVEIGIVIGDTVECALFRKDNQPVVEKRAPKDPDVIFHIRPETVEILNSQTKDEIGEIGLNILKEILAGHIEVKVPGKITRLLRRGYLEIISRGGAPVKDYLKTHGFSSVPKIFSAIKQMRS